MIETPGIYKIISEGNSNEIPKEAQPAPEIWQTSGEIDKMLRRNYNINNKPLANWISEGFQEAYHKGFQHGSSKTNEALTEDFKRLTALLGISYEKPNLD